VRIATRMGTFGELLHALVPRVAQIVMNTSFRMFPDSEAAKGGYYVGVTHVSFPGIGRLRTDGSGYEWLPVNYTRP